MSIVTNVLYIVNDKELSIDLWQELTKEVPSEYRNKANRFCFWEDRQAYLFGKLLIKKILKKYSDKNLEDVKHNEFGKPFVLDEVSFNISHSGKYVICLFSLTKNALGIDIEKIDFNLKLEDFHQVLTLDEITNLKESKSPMSTFFDIWTIKEAAIKADGRGLNLPLKEIKINENNIEVEGKYWYYKALNIHNDYKCHIVLDTSGFITEINEISIDSLREETMLLMNQ